MATIAVLGTLDTKGHEHAFVADQIRRLGHQTLLVDVGSGDMPQVKPDITREEVACAGDVDLAELRARGDRGECVSAMAFASPRILERLYKERRIDGVISLGGGGGTAIATAAMRVLPIGFPKLMVSTLASGNTAHYVGNKDITMMPSIVDVAGLNRISRTIFRNAAAAICGMVDSSNPSNPSNPNDLRKSNDLSKSSEDRPLIVASMFGNTTQCVNAATAYLERAGYEVLVFHATGAGGRAMESLIESGLVDGVLDITTTEWADELVGGTLSAGPSRLEAAAKASVPAIVVPGCLDMVNFGERETVPQKFRDRTLYVHNPQVTLMRTSESECRELGRIIADKINTYTAPVTLLLPRKGISIISAPGQPFYDPIADTALFDTLVASLHRRVPVVSMDCSINDPSFAKACAEALLVNINAKRGLNVQRS